ncbi:uncharacterized protein A1O9_11286 [Exophiala aquamarina CBS 119918]|uniref:Uncharacterized protein n=1 Tax=Exophiala aquamarina CBS 119918 TaxID=1182545 RepID=A0A072P0S8_9EURO|nr:uncharacterized protein A1O9_11286 [Exophiala aquamarina CBS 119918]KEF52868.1 hypothetical protein A1O9_11286 [Exophiala aquamarina CBS 119918]
MIAKGILNKITTDVDDFKQNLSVTLQILQVKDSSIFDTNTEEVKSIVKVAQAYSVANCERDCLKPPDAMIDYNIAHDQRYDRTREWLVSRTAFPYLSPALTVFISIFHGEKYGNALQAAYRRGHAKISKRALYGANGWGYEKLGTTLLAVGVNAQNKSHMTAFYAAATCGHEKVVQLLLNGGADVNTEEVPALCSVSRYG